jgi:alkylation response protein AidB-like acyl-CoA dehydrogenase
MIEYLNSEERALAEAAREYARARLADLDRQCDRDESSICSVLPELAEMGFLVVRVPQEMGGLGCSRLTYVTLMHEIGYASPSACVTLTVHNMVAEMLCRQGSERVRADVVPQIGTAANLGSFAISEADAGSDAGACSTRAVRDGDEWVINGSKMWITNGLAGRWFVTLVQTKEQGDKDGLCIILVDGQQEGFERLKITGKMGLRGSETASIHLTDVRAPHDYLLADVGEGFKTSMATLNGGRLGIAAQATGIAEACLDQMVAYAKQRVQFGQPIANFQAIQEMLADSAVDLAAAESLVAWAASKPGHSRAFVAAAAKAKLFATEMAFRVADRAVQVHGGTGYVNDSVVEKLFRDVRVTRIYEGTSEIQRLVIARELLADGVDAG